MPPRPEPTPQSVLNKMHELVMSKIKLDNLLGENVYSGLLVGSSESLRRQSGNTSKLAKNAEEQRAYSVFIANLSLTELLIIQNNLNLLWQMSENPDFSDDEKEKLKRFIEIIAMQLKQDINLTNKLLSEQAYRDQLAMEKVAAFNRLIETSTVLARMAQWINLQNQITILKISTQDQLITTQQQYINELIERTTLQIAQLQQNPTPENNAKAHELNHLLMQLKVARNNIANANIARNQVLEQCRNADNTYNPQLLRAREAELNAHYQEVENNFTKIGKLIPSSNIELQQVLAKANTQIDHIKQSHIAQEQELQQKITELGDVKGDCEKDFNKAFIALRELADFSSGSEQKALLQLADLFQQMSHDLSAASTIQENEQVMSKFASMLENCLQSPSLQKVKNNEKFISVVINLEKFKNQFNLSGIASTSVQNIRIEAQPILAADADSLPRAKVEIPVKQTTPSYKLMAEALLSPKEDLPQANLIEVDENTDILDLADPIPLMAEASVIEVRMIDIDNDTFNETGSLLEQIQNFCNEIQSSDPELSQRLASILHTFKETLSEDKMCQAHYQTLADLIEQVADKYPENELVSTATIKFDEISDSLTSNNFLSYN